MNERYQLLSALSGPAIKCLIAFCWERRQLTVSELRVYVGHDKNTVRSALAQLALYGLSSQVIASQETWCLTDKGYQLPLPMSALPEGSKDKIDVAPVSGEKISHHSTTTTTRSASSENGSGDRVVAVRTDAGGENLTTAPQEDVDSVTTANLLALKKAGINGRKAMELSKLEWVTPEYVDAMHARWQSEGYTPRDTGLLVTYIKDGDPAPIVCGFCGAVGGHRSNCPELLPDSEQQSAYELIASDIMAGNRAPVSKPTPKLVQAMMRVNQRNAEMW